METNKLYVFILKSLSTSQKAVQAGHVVSVIASKHPDIDWNQQTFVYLNASKFQLKKLGIKDDAQYFIEPDLNDELTAVAIFGSENEYSSFQLI